MDARDHYEKYWGKKKGNEEFYAYERNSVLPELFAPDEKLLDVGCGDGAVGEELIKNGLKVYGVDLSKKAVTIARKRGVKAKQGSVEEKIPYKTGEFDSVFWGDNMEHLFNPQKTLNEINRVLKPRGKLVLSCPNMGYWRYRIHYLLNGKLPDTEWSGNPPWYWSHIRFFNVNIIKEFLKAENFTFEKVVGVNRRPVESSLSKNVPDFFAMILVIVAKKNG